MNDLSLREAVFAAISPHDGSETGLLSALISNDKRRTTLGGLLRKRHRPDFY